MLYIVPTPIGNLEDITLRAITVLRATDIIIAENPSYTKRLLTHLQIAPKRLLQYAEHNELQILDKIIRELESNNACLVTDAGTPGISDPGFRLVRACIAVGIEIVSLPGPSAAITALAGSGLPTDRFSFVGFLPKTEPKVQQLIQTFKAIESTIIAYESPNRIYKTMQIVAKFFPEAKIVIARELSKIHEEYIRGNAPEVVAILKAKTSIKGEVTLLISFK